MKLRLSALAVFSAAVFVAPVPVAAQTPAPRPNSPAKAAPAAPVKWTPPRLANGHPDFGGYWNNHTATPLQRPDNFSGREFLTDAELKDMEQRFGRPIRFAGTATNPFSDLWAGDARWVM